MSRDLPANAPAPSEWWWVFDPRCSLRARAALVFGGLALAVVLLVAWIGGTIFRPVTENQVTAMLEGHASELNEKLALAVHERARELRFAASLPVFRSEPSAVAARRETLDRLQASSPEFAWLGFVDAAGRVRVATQHLLEDENALARPWFGAVREHGYAALLDAWPALIGRVATADDEEAGRLLVLAWPVTGANGEFLGVLAGALGWDWARTTQALAFSEPGRRARLGATVYDNEGRVLIDSGNSGWTQPLPAPTLADPRALRGALRENVLGFEYLTGFARGGGQPEYRGLGWVAIVRQPADAALAPIRDLRRTLVWGGVVFILATVVTSWVAAGRFARRLRSMAAAANRIREDDILTVMPPAHGHTEFDRMCGAVGELVEDFRTRQEKIAPTPPGTEPHLKSRTPATDQIHRLV